MELITFPHRDAVGAIIRDIPGTESTDHREKYFTGIDGAIGK